MNKKYRVAIIGRTGHGDYGHDISTVWAELPERVEVVGLADDDPAGLAKAAARLKVERTYADYRKLLDEQKPDIVAVCQRHVDLHHAMIMAALERGMHVLTEKPLCRTLAEADEIVRRGEMTHAVVAVAHQTRYSPKIAVVKKLIADGRLGTVLELRGRGKEDARGGGEDLWVLGSHIMDLMRTFGGQAEWCFAKVACGGRPIRSGDVAEGNEGLGLLAGDSVDAVYGMSGGATAYFGSHRGAGGSPARFGLQIFGSKGVLEIGTGYLPTVKLLEDSSWSPGRSGKVWQDVSSDGVGVAEPLTDGSALAGNIAAVKDMLAAIENGRPPLMNASEARAAIEMIVACFESQRVGGPAKLPLAERGNPLGRLKN
jgi:predicted dehydrogenase